MLRAVILSSLENREAETRICRKRRKKKSREAGKAEKQGKQNAEKQRSRKAEKQEKQRSNVAEKQKSREAEKQKIRETGKHRTRNPKKSKTCREKKPKIDSPPYTSVESRSLKILNQLVLTNGYCWLTGHDSTYDPTSDFIKSKVSNCTARSAAERGHAVAF